MSQPPADDPFALLGLPRDFNLADSTIEQAYFSKAAALHPDRFIDPVEQAEAVRESARVNDARKTLLDKESRANTLLRLLGGPSREEDNDLPDAFLVEILEVREEMEEDIGNPQRRRHWEDWAQTQRQTYLRRVRDLFATVSGGSLGTAAAAAIRRELNALRYIERMIEQLDPDYDQQAKQRRR